MATALAEAERIMEKGAPTLKRIFLELGGKSASIILEDTPNFAEAVGQSIACFHAGQGCAMITRLLIPESRYAEAVAVLEGAYGAYSQMWGDPDEPTNIMGPVISARPRERVLGYIQAGIDEGARLLAGGKAATDKGNGFFIEPTCFVDVNNSMKIAREEIFGPVLVVIPFKDDDDAVRIANDQVYRREQSAAIAARDHEIFDDRKALALVEDVFAEMRRMAIVRGDGPTTMSPCSGYDAPSCLTETSVSVAQGSDQQRERRRRQPPARIVKVVTSAGWTPVLEHPDEPTPGEVRGDVVLR